VWRRASASGEGASSGDFKGKIVFTPVVGPDRAFYKLERLGYIAAKRAPPRQQLHRWWPQRDSNPCLLSATRFLNPID